MQWVDHDMSSDTAKDNASVVDSSATDWKQEMGNTDDPGNKIYVSNRIVHNLF